MLNILVSPLNENKNGEKYAKKIVKYLKAEKIEFSVYFSLGLADLKENVKNLTLSGETDFIVIGNDVTLSEFVNNAKDISKVKLGIIPTSRHDDFASYLRLETNPVLAIKNIIKGEVERVDLLLMNNVKVVNSIIIGASTLIQEVYNQYRVKNSLSKQYAFMRYGNKFDGIDLKFEIKNQKPISANIFELSIANGGHSQGKPVSPLANASDGLFNFNFVSTPQRENRKKYLRLFKKGEHIYHDQTKQLWINNLKITNPDNKIKIMADGKIMTVEDLTISVLENGLKIYKSNHQ